MNRTLERRTAHGTFGFCTHDCMYHPVPCYWLVSLSCVRVVAVVCSAAHAEPYEPHDDALEVEPGGGAGGDGCAVGCHGHGQPLEAMIASRATPSDPRLLAASPIWRQTAVESSQDARRRWRDRRAVSGQRLRRETPRRVAAEADAGLLKFSRVRNTAPSHPDARHFISVCPLLKHR
jgi:hypothetical protein